MVGLSPTRSGPDTTDDTDLRSCVACGGLVDAAMRDCPTCGRWLGPGRVALWLSLVVGGGLLILMAFFAPWLSVTTPAPGYQLSGNDLARIAHAVAVDGGTRPTYAASLALYLAPTAALAMFTLVGLRRPLRLTWAATGRLLVALAAVPLQVALLVLLLMLGNLTTMSAGGWPRLGPVIMLLGSAFVVGSGMVLGGRRRPQSWR